MIKKNTFYIYFLVMCFIFICVKVFRDMIQEIPPVESLRNYELTLSTKVYDINEELITELYTEKRTWVPLSKIPIDLQNAVIANEDHRFFKHWGVSFRGIMRAFLHNIIRRRVVAGGSTITQQLAKLSFLSQERTVTRKLKELLLAFQLEGNFSKQEILEMYLNQIYFGHGAYGVEQAARVYFSKKVEEINLAECALLVGLIKYPHYYSPFRHHDRAAYRRQTVLARVRRVGYITEREELAANAEKIVTERTPVTVYTAPYFIEHIRLALEPKYGPRRIYQAGWNVYSTLDIKMQQAAEKATEEFLARFDEEKKKEMEKIIEKVDAGLIDPEEEEFDVPLTTDIPKVQCGLLAIEPRTGQIRAFVGGRDFKETQFNRVLQAYRQVGSAFKPFVYTAAIERGYTPTYLIEDTPVVYVNDGHDWQLAANTTSYLLSIDPEILEDPMKVWVPENYKKQYYGKVLLRKALERSMNICAIKTIEEIGPTTVIEYARRFGITGELTNTLSLALGSSDVTLLEMVRAFSVFANRGIKVEPYSIRFIQDKDGRIIEENSVREEDVLSPRTSYIMSNILQGVVNNGTGRYAWYYLKRPAAGKTGTTNDYSDAWFIGYTPELLCGVWVGYDDRRTLGDKKSGGAVACPVWTNFMREALSDYPVTEFPDPPTGITFAEVDPASGLLVTDTTGYIEAFISGTEPAVTVDEVDVDKLLEVPPSTFTAAGLDFLSKHALQFPLPGTTDYDNIDSIIFKKDRRYPGRR